MAEAVVFLDRDGVLDCAIERDGRPFAPGNLDEMEMLSGVSGACVDLSAAGYVPVVVTIQTEIARGGIDAADLGYINRWLANATGVHHVRVCRHAVHRQTVGRTTTRRALHVRCQPHRGHGPDPEHPHDVISLAAL